MKLFFVLAALLATFTSAEASVSGDKIEFQRISTFVSALYNKSLCLRGDTYEAMVNSCAKWENRGGDDDRECTQWVKVKAFQPMNSTRQRCARFGGHDDDCVAWETVPYYQSPVRKVEVYSDSGDNERLVKTITVTVPACSGSDNGK